MVFELIVVFCLTILMIFLLKQYAYNFSLISLPNDRSDHMVAIPKGAGIGFVSSVFIVLAIFHFDIVVEYLWSIVAIFLIFMIGIYDDMFDSSPEVKFLSIIVATILLCMDGMVIDNIGVYLDTKIYLGWLALPFSMFAISGVTNALNLIDGIDGLAASISIIIFSIFAILGYNNKDMFMFYISTFFIVALFAFLIFNWSPASIFMGDSGSLTLGFIIAMLSIKALEYMSAISMVFIVGVPILDTVIAIVRRKVSNKSITQPDKCHIHHILKTLFGNNVPKTVIFLTLVQLLYVIFGFVFSNIKDDSWMLVVFILNIWFLYIWLQSMIKKQKRGC